jgi:hypothetical protein
MFDDAAWQESFVVEWNVPAAQPLTNMPALPWSDFIELHHRAHLLVAALRSDSVLDPDDRLLLSLMKRLVAKLPIEGPYAATIDRSGGSATILCAFAQRGDADRLADHVRAVPLDNTAGWATARRFALDADARERLLDFAGPSMGRRRSAPAEPSAS